MKTNRTIIALMVGAAVLVGPAAVLAATALPKIAKNTPYETARATMMKLGFSGVLPEGGGNCGTREEICKKWPETEACGGTGRAPCSFVWRKGALVVEIETVGERGPVVSRILCREGC